ncbi:hypothetical protein KAR91_07035 [Candidatus Pacearchaeota archaeon]|nr:hypothetical protein [Candidatus Pacearchaeota archaeon]
MLLNFNINFKLDKKKTQKQAELVLFFCMLKMQELATIYAPVDTGRLKTSIKIFPTAPGFKYYTLSDGVDYGIHIEYGTSPHYVSPKHLKDWARRVLGDENAAFPIAKKIALKGVNAQPFFRPAFYQVQDVWVKRFWKKYM